ncbi:MAG: porin family protein [Flavobacteriales bacterium]
MNFTGRTTMHDMPGIFVALPMRLRSLFLSLLAVLCLGGSVQAQGRNGVVKTLNLPNYDLHPWHFGFHLGYNTSDFFLDMKPRAIGDSVLVIDHMKQPGFNLAPMASFSFSPNLSIRLLTCLSFQERILKYQFRKADGKVAYFDKPIESTYMEFPLLLKMRSDRINNFAVYVVAGGKFSIDVASQKDVNNALDQDVVVKLARYDYSVEVGGGCDMFLPYFKFGLELKAAFGIPNMLVDDATRFSDPLRSLRTKVWVLSFTFES